MESQGLSKKTFQRDHRLFEIFPPTLAASLCQLLWLLLWLLFPRRYFLALFPFSDLCRIQWQSQSPCFLALSIALQRAGSLECQGVFRRGQSWGHSQLLPPGGDIFTKLLYPLLARLWPFWAPGSLASCHQPPLLPPHSLFAFPNRGPNYNSTKPHIVFPILHCVESCKLFFFWICSAPIYWPVFCHPHLSQRGFVDPRPPAGIREDNSGAFRWVFLWLLLLSSSGNIIGTVHFAAASLLCPAVTQSIRLSCSSFSLGFEACLSFVIALQFTPCNSKEIDFSVFFFHPRAFCT